MGVVDMWGFQSNGSFYLQAKVVGGNMATNGMAWLRPYKISIEHEIFAFRFPPPSPAFFFFDRE